MRNRILASLALVVSLASACATVAMTGRSQLMLVSDAQMIALSNQERTAFFKAAQDKGAILSRSESPAAANLIDRVSRVAGRIVAASGLQSQVHWSLTIVKYNNINANVMPNGSIGAN